MAPAMYGFSTTQLLLQATFSTVTVSFTTAVVYLNIAWQTVKPPYLLWESGRQVFKTLRLTVKTIDEAHQLENRSAGSVVENFPEPAYSAYKLGLMIYPDWDSNYVRTAQVLKVLNEPGKAAIAAFVGGFAIVHEIYNRDYIKQKLSEVKSSDKCRYSITEDDISYFQSVLSKSPEQYAFEHHSGERILKPLVYGYLDESFKGVIEQFITSAVYITSDVTTFKLLFQDVQDIVYYAGNHTECVIKVSEVSTNSCTREDKMTDSINEQVDTDEVNSLVEKTDPDIPGQGNYDHSTEL